MAGWKSPASKPQLEETVRRERDGRETSAESQAALGQVFPKPRELTPREEGPARALKGDTFIALVENSSPT